MTFHAKTLALAVSALFAGAAHAAPAADPVLASLGPVTIGQGEMAQLLQGLSDAERAAIKADRAGVEAWLRQRLTAEALLREARAKGWGERPEIKARVDSATRELSARLLGTSYLESVAAVDAAYPPDAELAAAYEQGKADFALPARYRVAQIFLAAPDAGAQAKLREAAKKLAAQARSGDFAALARSQSQEARSAAQGGEVGMLPLESLLPELRDGVAKMKVGQVAEPVPSPAGFHIVKLLGVEPARTATLAEMTPRLRAALRQQRQQQLAQAYLANLAPAASLTIDGAALDAALQKLN